MDEIEQLAYRIAQDLILTRQISVANISIEFILRVLYKLIARSKRTNTTPEYKLSIPNLYKSAMSFISRFRKKPPYKQSKVLKRIRKLERGVTGKERKYHDYELSATNVTTTASIPCLNLIAQGDQSLSQREGREINVLSYELKLSIQTNVLNAAGSSARFMVVTDKQTNGATPAITDFLESEQVISFRDHQTAGRFITHFDKTIDTTRRDASTGSIRLIRHYKRFKRPIKVVYSDTTASITSILKNSMFLVYFSNASSNYPVVTGRVRIRYTD